MAPCALLLLAVACTPALATVYTTTVFLNPLEDLNTATTVNGVTSTSGLTTGALGYATVTLDDAASTVAVSAFTAAGLSGNIAASHFHLGAIGANGAVLIALNHTNTSVTSVTYSLTSGQVAAFLSGNVYMNVHTASFPAGEFRAQVGFNKVGFAVLTGSQDNATTPAYGFASVLLNDASGNVTVTTLNLVGVVNATAAHIHGPGAPGAAGPVVCPIASGTVPNVTSNFSCPTTLGATQLASMRAGNYYFNVHTPTYPNGAIRGQIYFPYLMGAPTLTGVEPSSVMAGEMMMGGMNMSMMMGGTGLGYSMLAPYNGSSTSVVAWYAITNLNYTETNASFAFASGAPAPISPVGQGAFAPVMLSAGQSAAAGALVVYTNAAPASSPPPAMSPPPAASGAASASSAAAAAVIVAALAALL